MRRSKADVERYISTFQGSSPSQKATKGLLFAKLYFEAGEYELAKSHVSEYLTIQPKDPNAHKLLGQLFEQECETDKAVGCYKRSLDLNPAQPYLVLKVAELLCSKPDHDSRAEYWVEKAARLLPRNPTVSKLREYLCQLSVSSNKQASCKFHKELLLAQCNRVKLALALKGCEESTAALWSFDCAMQALKNTATNMVDELAEVFTEMRAHLYLYAGTLLLKRAQDGAQQWRDVVDLATLCYLISYQSPRPKAKSFKSEQVSHEPLELLACDRQSQAGHMLLNLSQDMEQLLKDVVEGFGNRSGPGPLFYELFNAQMQKHLSFICNDDIHILSVHLPKATDLAKWDSGAVLLHAGDLQHLAWLGLQWALMGQSVSLQDWLKQLFPRLTLETSKLDTNAPESICLLDLEVFMSGVVFCSQTQLQEKEMMSHEPRCLPLHIMKQLLSDRQRQWWDAAYSLIYKRALPGTSAKLRLVVQLGLSTLRAGERHGLQPALLIHWAKHLAEVANLVNSYYDQKDYADRSVHYWKVVLPLLKKVRQKHGIPEPLQPLFMHFRSKDIQPSQVQIYEEDADISFATLLDIEGNTEEAIAKLEKLNSISSNWHLLKIYQRLSEETGSGLEETQGRFTNFLQKFQKFLTKINLANAEDMEKLPVSVEEVMELLNEVNQQLEDTGETEDQVDYPLTSSPCHPTKGRIKFSTPSPSKSVTSPSKRSVFSPKTPPHWVEDQKSMLQMLCQQVEVLTNEVHDLRRNCSDATTPFKDSEVTLEWEKQSTANKEQRASSDSEAEAKKPHDFITELQKLQQAQVKPKPFHDVTADDMSDGGAEEHQTETLVTDGSRPNDLFTERSGEIDFSTATDLEVTLERKKRSTANEEQRASSDSETEAEKPDDNTELQKLQQAQVKPKPSHDAAAVDTSGGGAEEHQTDKPVTDGSRPTKLSTERSSEIDSSTATHWILTSELKKFLSTRDSEVTLEREKRSTANEEQRASSDSEAEAELQHSTSSSCLALDTQVKPKPSHNAAAVDTSDGGAEEHQTDKPVTDGSRSNDLSTERSSEIDSSTATDVNFTWPNAGASVFGSAATQNEAEETRNEAEEEGSNEVKPKSSHDAAAVDMSDGGAEEHQTDTPAAERSSESNSSTATGWNLFADLARGSGEFTFGKKDVNFTWPNAGAPALRSAATQNESEETCNEGKGSAEQPEINLFKH